MENNHLTYFKVENFKKFDSLEVNDIGQFNLIVGDNNVGKTCLLEALLVDENYQEMLNNFAISLCQRSILVFGSGNTPLLNFIPKNKTQPVVFSINHHIISLESKNTNDMEANFYHHKMDFPLIAFGGTIDNTINELYNRLGTKKEKEFLINVLKVLFIDLENIEYKTQFNQINNTYIFTFKNEDNFIPLHYLGDGFKRIFYITLKALALRGKRLMIDEIEIGIHYSRQKEFFVNLFKICNELDVQLFATTHSKECIEAFVEASKEIEEKDIRLIRLQENKDKSIKAICYPFDAVEYIVESNTEER